MKRTRIKRFATWVLLALPPSLVGAIMVLLAWGQMPFVAHAAGGQSVSFGLDVASGTSTGSPPLPAPAPMSPPAGCTSPGGGYNCAQPVDGVFTVRAYINNVALKDHGGVSGAGYTAVNVRLNYDTGLGVSKSRPGVTELGPMGSPYWPGCFDPYRGEDTTAKLDGTPSYIAGCGGYPATESTYTGLVMEQVFTCDTPGKHWVSLKSTGNLNDSSIIDDSFTSVYDPAGTKYVVVECQGDKGANPAVDSDSDGCTDVKEQGPNTAGGGQRNKDYFWDFFDVWTHPVGMPSVWVRDKVVVLADIYAIVARFASVGNPNGNPLLEPVADTGYHVAYDRTQATGPDPWRVGPPSGAIGLEDINQAAKPGQIFTNCN